jgi:hypothetical protein
MAACIVETTQLTSISYQTTNLIKQTKYSHVNSYQMDSTKKRQLSRNNTFNSNNDLTKTETDSSCSTQAVSINNNNNESMKCP